MRAFHSAAAPQFSHMALQTYAAYPVWKDSARAEVKFMPLPKRQAVKIFHDARRFERQTRRAVPIGAKGFMRTREGKLGRSGIMVLHTLLFDFLNYSSGRLDPSYAAIAEKALVSVRTVARALARLKAAGVLNWVRRCSESVIDGQFILEQETNAYGVAPPGHWRGYRPAPEPPPPDPAAWGKAPPWRSALDLAAAALGAGDRRRGQQLLECDPGDGLAGALASLGRRRGLAP